MEGKGAATIVLPTQGSESLQFLEALCKTRIANFVQIKVSVHTGIVLFAGKIEQCRLPRDPTCGGDIDAPGNDLSKGPYFV